MLQLDDKLMDEIGAKLLKYMQDNNFDHVAAPGVLPTRPHDRAPRSAMRLPSREYVIEQGHVRSGYDWRANAKMVFEFIDSNGFIPPGLNTSSFTKVNVRRPNEKE